jgi:hypothetical protein
MGADRYDFSVDLSAVTPTSIPITLPVVGTCNVTINTAPGPSPTITITGSARFASQTLGGPIDKITFENIDVTNLTAEDVTITGSVPCAAASFSLAFFVGTLAGTLEDNVARGLCVAPGPTLVQACPSLSLYEDAVRDRLSQ